MGSSAPSWSADFATASSWLTTGVRLSPGRREQVLSTVERASELLGWEGPPCAEQIVDLDGALQVMARAWQETTESLGAGPATHERLTVLVDLLRDIRAAEDGVRDDRSIRDGSTAQVVREALSGLRDVRTVADLAARAPGAAAMVGFDRVLLSRIEDSSWIPESMFVTNDARWAEEIIAAGRQDVRTLDNSLLETQIVRRNRPLVVADTDEHANLHRSLIDATRTRSYTAAPIVGWGRVIGFLHADCYQQRRTLDGTDRDLLWMFCDGLGHLVVRAAAMDAVQSLRGELDRLSARIGSFDPDSDAGWPSAVSGEAPGSRITMPSRDTRSTQPRWLADSGSDLADVEGALTRREVEVMRLMGAGHTNAQIARRLVISEGTVKSHVKHILRKLQAANRAEAVSRWLRDEHARHLAKGRPERPASRIGA